ncbi:hypothetical protein ACL02U_20035 [Streptomyces sp. MS06]|uniref:hypothetical protein n=1 Tax=Streptomyces sp. MS06 TaxID=3385974 RepID=UPI0039A0519E
MKKATTNALRALIVGGVMLAATGSSLAYAHGRGDDGGPTSISHINNGNTYSYQGVGTITLDNLLGGGTDSLLLTPIRAASGRLNF